jgi:hypothetical protein
MALWILPKRGLLCVGAKANVPLCGGKKCIVLKKVDTFLVLNPVTSLHIFQ